MNPRSILGCAWLLAVAQTARPQTTPTAAVDYAVRSYKTVGVDSLVTHVFVPKGAAVRRPAAVLFHGGGFVQGGPDVTDGSARDYAARGIVAFSVDYRLANRSTITPIEQTEDTFDAIRWVRRHATEYAVDTSRIVAHGVSAGGYLVAMAAGSKDDAVRPQVLVLWSPGVGRGDDPYFQGLLVGRARGPDVSPPKNIRVPMPATVIISGALDSVTFDLNARRQEKVWAFLRSLGYIAKQSPNGHRPTERLTSISTSRPQVPKSGWCVLLRTSIEQRSYGAPTAF